MKQEAELEIKKPEEGKVSQEKKIESETLIRILSTDIPGNKNIYTGLTRIKGVSWTFSNAICKALGIDKKRKISSLTKEEIAKISDFIKNPQLPEFVMNRRKDFETEKQGHLVGTDLELKKDFDVKRLRKIKSYKGWRHATGQPVRGQRTRSHFRKNKALGVAKKGVKGKKG